MAEELELKLRLPADALPRLRRLALPGAAPGARGVSELLHSIYFDTPELTLRRAGLALRLRRAGRSWVQTLKGGGGAEAGLHRRSEWEQRVPGPELDLSRLRTPAAALLHQPGVREALRPVFVTEFRRRRRLLRFEGGDTVEFSLDRGEVRAEHAALPLCEIELELKSGSPQRLFDLGFLLARELPVRLEGASKAERGYALALAEPPAPRKAGTVALAPEASVDEAFRAIVRACLGQLQANEDGMLEGRDPEYLHQMRVALRRLRSALTLFRAALPREALDAPLPELRWLAAQLGPARDWDVFMTETLPRVAAPAVAPGMEAFRTAAESRRRAAAELAREAVQSRRYQELLLSVGAWLEAEPWLAALPPEGLPAAHGPVAQFARELLERQQRRVRKRGRGFARLAPADRHRLRIAAKRLRYAGEFFSALFPGRETRAYLKSLAGLQDQLGALNDAAVTEHLVREAMAGAPGPEAAAGAAFIEGWVAADAAHKAAHSKQAWKKFLGREPFWK